MSDRKPLIYAPRVPELPPKPSISMPSIALPTVPKLVNPAIIGPYKPQKPSLMDYGNEYQINSMADIVLTTFNKNMKRKSFEVGGVDISDIPILNMIPSAFQYVNDAYVTPISRGDWGAVGLNTLTNLSETLDVLANPVKGLALEGSEGFKNALGFGIGGRKNYDYDTGNIVGDIALELISDPLNWVTLFGKGAVSATIKSMSKTGLAELGEEAGQVVANKAYKQLANAITDSFMKSGHDDLAKAATDAAKSMMKRTGTPPEFTEAFLKGLKSFSLDNTTAHVLDSLNKVIRPVEAFEKQLFKVAIGVPYAAGYLVKKSGKPVWEFLHTKIQEVFKGFSTPSGNLDVLQYDDINKYVQRWDATTKEIYDTEFPTEEIKKIYMREAILKEKDQLLHYIRTDLAEMPNVNMQGKVKLFTEYIEQHTQLSPGLVMDIIEDLNQATDNRYQWLYNVLYKNLDMEGAKLADRRSAIWTTVKDLQAKIKELKTTDALDNYDVFSKYLKDKFSMTPFDLLQEARTYQIDLGSEFSWLEEYFNKGLKDIDINPVKKMKHQLSQEMYKILTAPRKLEAETRFNLIDDWIRKEHNIGILEYLQRLKKLERRYPGEFAEYITELESQIKRLKLIDGFSKRNAERLAVKETVQKTSTLLKEQQEVLVALPERTGDTLQQIFIRQFVQNDNPQQSLKGLGLNPIVYETHVLKQRFTKATRQEYIDQIHLAYNNFVANRVLQDVLNPEFVTNKEYSKIVKGVQRIFNQYWKELEGMLRKQMRQQKHQFYVDDLFTYLSKDLQEYIESKLPGLAQYSETIKVLEKVNDTVDYDKFLRKEAKAYKEVLENLQSFRQLPQLKELDNLKNKILYIDRSPTIGPDFIKTIQKDFARSVNDFFREVPYRNPVTSAWQRANDLGTRFFKAQAEGTRSVEALQLLQKDFMDAKDVARQIEKLQKTVKNTGTKVSSYNLSENIKYTIEQWTAQGVRVYGEAMVDNFEHMFAALALNKYDEFLDYANDIVLSLHAISRQNRHAANMVLPLYDLFKSYNLANYVPFSATIEAEEVWYRVKIEQGYVMGLLMADKDINDFINDLLTPTSELGTMFKNLVATDDPAAKNFMDSLVSYKNYKGFLTDLYKYIGNPVGPRLPIDHDMLGAFISTLQKYAMRDPETLLKNLENNFYYILEQTEAQINSMRMGKHLNLDDMTAVLEKNPKYAKVLEGLEGHHALDDAQRTYYICDAELAEEFKKLYGKDVTVLHLDLETNGLNGNVHEITEMGLFSPELGIKHEDIFEPASKGQKRAQVAKTPRAATVQSELDVLKNFMGVLQKHDGEDIVINMHNGFKFDKRFIINRLQYYYHMSKALDNQADVDFCVSALGQLRSGKYKFSDSLKMLQQKYGYTVIADEDREALFYTLQHFAESQKDMSKFIQPIDPSLATQLKDMGIKLRDALGEEARETYEPYFKSASAIFDFFKNVGITNKEYGQILIKKSLFDNEAFQKYFGALNITQALNTKPIFNEAGEAIDHEIIDGVKMFGVKKFMDANAIMEYFDGVHLDEYQMQFRTDIARSIDREYSMLQHSTKLKYYDTQMREILQEFLKRAQTSPYVSRDLMALKVHDDYMSNYAILQMLFKYKSKNFDGIPISKTILETGEEYINYADNVLTGLVSDVIPEDFRILLENPELVRVRAYIDDGSLTDAVDLEVQSIWRAKQVAREAKYAEQQAIWNENKTDYLELQYKKYQAQAAANAIATDKAIAYQVDTVAAFAKKLDINPELANYKNFHTVTEHVLADYKDLMTMFDELGKGWDDNGAHRAVVQMRGTVLKDNFKLLEAVSSRHSTIADVSEQFKQVMKYREIPDLMVRQQIEAVIRLTDDDLYAHLINEARRWIAFDGFELSGDQLKSIIDRAKVLEQKQIHTVFKDNKIFWVLDQAVKIDVDKDAMGKVKHLVNGKHIVPPALTPINIQAVVDGILTDPADAEIKQALLAIYDKLYTLVGDYDSAYSPHYGSIGELTTTAYYKEAYDVLPDEVKKFLPHRDVMYDAKYFHGGTFNHSILGGSKFRREFHKYTTSDIVSMLNSTMTQQIQHLKSHVEYMHMFFDKTLSISNGEISKFSEQTLLEALQSSSEYRLVALVDDPKRGAKVVDLNPKNLSDIKKAKELNAVVMSYQTYSTAFGAINSFGMRHDKLNMFHKINYLYKAGYLLTPGAFMRNVIDSVMKNYIAAGDDATGMTQSFISSWQMYQKYRRTAKELIEFSKEPVTGKARITAKSTKEYFESGVSPLSKVEFDFIHGFDVDGPSGGQIREFEKYFQHGETYGVYGTAIQAISWMMQPTQTVEQVCRLAEYMWAIEKGMPTTKAYALIAKTHFDYAIKTDMQRLIELIFPFYTFTQNNIHYWLDAFDSIPALPSILRDVYTPIWNLDEYTPEQLKYNRSLQYQILSGNLPLTESGMTLKLNPSFMDVYSLATDPINTIKGKLSPVMQTGVGLAGADMPEEMKYAYGIPATATTPQEAILELLPIAGPLINRMFEQGPKYYERTGNVLNAILPSVFGATAKSKEYEGYKTKQYKKYTKYAKAPRRGYVKKIYPKKGRKFYAKRFFAKAQKYYAKKVYSSVGYAADNFYNRLYSSGKTGKSRLRSMAIPVTGQTLKYRLKDMFYYYK